MSEIVDRRTSRAAPRAADDYDDGEVFAVKKLETITVWRAAIDDDDELSSFFLSPNTKKIKGNPTDDHPERWKWLSCMMGRIANWKIARFNH